MARLRALWLAVLLLVLLPGCAPPDGAILVKQWALVTAAGPVGVVLPTHLDSRVAATPSRYAIEAHVAVPDDWRGVPLTLAIAHFEGRATLFANGAEAVRVDPDMFDSYRSIGPQAYRIAPSIDGVAHLRLEVDHQFTRSAWLDTVPRLTPDPRGGLLYRVVRGINLGSASIGLGVCSAVSLSYLVVFLLDRRRKEHFWFSIQAGGVSLYTLYGLGANAPLLGKWDVGVTSAAGATGGVASIFFTHAYFHLAAPHAVWRFMLAVPALITLVAGPHGAHPIPEQLHNAVVTTCTVYQLWTLWKVARRPEHRLGARALMAAWGWLSVAAPTELFFACGNGELAWGIHGVTLGTTGFAVIQLALLSREYMRTLVRADALNIDLAGRVSQLEERNAEVSVLNAELQRQVADRSRQLAQALGRMGALPARACAPAPGEVLNDRYKIVRQIGQGGMGAVFEVERLSDSRHLALKVLTAATTGEAVARFAREAHIAARVAHKNLVSVVDVDVSATGTLYVVMELVQGNPLSDERDRGRSPEWALPVLVQVAEGIEALHATGVVHRDLKPANILLTGSPQAPMAKIADFGISRLPLEEPRGAHPFDETLQDAGAASGEVTVSAGLTRTGVVMGTPLYMAPELATGTRDAGPATDIWSFGVLAFELVLGRLPFAVPPVFLSAAALPTPDYGDMPPAIRRVVEACLLTNPSARPTAALLAEQLRASQVAHGAPGAEDA